MKIVHVYFSGASPQTWSRGSTNFAKYVRWGLPFQTVSCKTCRELNGDTLGGSVVTSSPGCGTRIPELRRLTALKLKLTDSQKILSRYVNYKWLWCGIMIHDMIVFHCFSLKNCSIMSRLISVKFALTDFGFSILVLSGHGHCWCQSRAIPMATVATGDASLSWTSALALADPILLTGEDFGLHSDAWLVWWVFLVRWNKGSRFLCDLCIRETSPMDPHGTLPRNVLGLQASLVG